MLRKLMIFLVIAAVVVSCAPKPEAVQIVEPDWNLLWEEDFSSSSNWGGSADLSVQCPGVDVGDEDMAYGIVDVRTPSQDKRALQIVSNAGERNGVFMNAIAHRDIETHPAYPVSVMYKLEGSFRPIGVAHLTNVAFNFVNDEVGHSAEIFFGTDESTKYYGLINVRNAQQNHINLIDLSDSVHDWHDFEMVVTIFEEENIYLINWIRVDGQLRVLNWQMPIFPKEGWQRIAQVYLEQHNQHQGCSSQNSSTGVSQWDSIRLYQASIGDPRFP